MAATKAAGTSGRTGASASADAETGAGGAVDGTGGTGGTGGAVDVGPCAGVLPPSAEESATKEDVKESADV